MQTSLSMTPKDSTDFVLFNWKNDCDKSRSEFSFEVVAEQHAYLCLELFDHSALKTHKYFRGAVYIPIEGLGKDADLAVTLESPLKKLPALGRNFTLLL